jgi:hypothetical protein
LNDFVVWRTCPTAGVTGKRGDLAARKLSDAESAVGAADSKVRVKAPHLSGARGVGPAIERGRNLTKLLPINYGTNYALTVLKVTQTAKSPN